MQGQRETTQFRRKWTVEDDGRSVEQHAAEKLPELHQAVARLDALVMGEKEPRWRLIASISRSYRLRFCSRLSIWVFSASTWMFSSERSSSISCRTAGSTCERRTRSFENWMSVRIASSAFSRARRAVSS